MESNTACLEKIRFSITRLKPCLDTSSTGRNFAWKDKILDYEIETNAIWSSGRRKMETWKDKILDYEIETIIYLLIYFFCYT